MQYIPWIDAINKAAAGRLVIEWKGGPEAVAPTAQLKPLSDGIYQVLYTSSAYYAAEIPAATFNNVLVGSPENMDPAGRQECRRSKEARPRAGRTHRQLNSDYGFLSR